jgi:hypothetical protein
VQTCSNTTLQWTAIEFEHLASLKNPREYVQRRGRVLRKSQTKSISHIYDVLVTPLFDPDEPPATAILEGELARAIEFGSHAINPGCVTDLQRLAIEHGLKWTTLVGAGFEDDDEARIETEPVMADQQGDL